MSEVQYTTMSPIKQAAALSEQPTIESPKDISVTGQPVWEIEMVMERPQACTTAAFPSISSEEEAEEAEDFGLSSNEGEEKIKAINMTQSIADELEKTGEDLVLSQSLNGSVTLGPQSEPLVPPAMQEQSGLFHPPTLQRVVTGCEIPEQRTTLEGSQVDD